MPRARRTCHCRLAWQLVAADIRFEPVAVVNLTVLLAQSGAAEEPRSWGNTRALQANVHDGERHHAKGPPT